jgi:threonine aldolase
MIELRSDTFTVPTLAMREAMARAVVGDDVYGEDPTVRHLEDMAADKLNKEASCLMPSGTMANLIAILAHCPRGYELLVGDESDVYHYEAGGASVLGGIVYHPVPTQPNGMLSVSALKQAIRDTGDSQCARPGLICLENSHNRCGGTVLPLAYLQNVRTFAQSQGLPVHIDGARLFNAALALNVNPAEIAQHTDSIQFCLSKGLGAPIGSMVVGSSPFIKEVRRLRKMLGGGMRQAGVIAAAGVVALEYMVDRLVEDHNNAYRLAEGLSKLPTIQIDLSRVETNIVIFCIKDERFTSQSFIESARCANVLVGECGHGHIRAVTHFGITSEDVDAAVAAFEEIIRFGPKNTRLRN